MKVDTIERSGRTYKKMNRTIKPTIRSVQGNHKREITSSQVQTHQLFFGAPLGIKKDAVVRSVDQGR